MPAKASTRVTIYDQPYTFGGEVNAATVQRLADRVDAKMRQVAQETQLVDSLRVAVLTAMNLADENEALRAQVERLEHQVAAKARELGRDLDRLLERAG
jgi:cell division protein ZapA